MIQNASMDTAGTPLAGDLNSSGKVNTTLSVKHVTSGTKPKISLLQTDDPTLPIAKSTGAADDDDVNAAIESPSLPAQNFMSSRRFDRRFPESFRLVRPFSGERLLS